MYRRNNTYLIQPDGQKEVIVIDPHAGVSAVLALMGLEPKLMMITHSHFDHIHGINAIRKRFPSCPLLATNRASKAIQDPQKNLAYYVPLLIHNPVIRRLYMMSDICSLCCEKAEYGFDDSLRFRALNIPFQLRAAPGHSPDGCLIYAGDGAVFCGDNWIPGQAIVLRLPKGNRKAYYAQTYPLLQSIPEGTTVYPGHNAPAKAQENWLDNVAPTKH